jgi:hypothetical protein
MNCGILLKTFNQNLLLYAKLKSFKRKLTYISKMINKNSKLYSFLRILYLKDEKVKAKEIADAMGVSTKQVLPYYNSFKTFLQSEKVKGGFRVYWIPKTNREFIKGMIERAQ